MHEEQFIYYVEGKIYEGFLASQDVNKKRPAILIFPFWKGMTEIVFEAARSLARMGYAGIAVDYYGDGKAIDSDDEAAKCMSELFVDRALLQKRIKIAYEAAKQNPAVDPSRIAAAGFCFGGLVAIELLRSGVDLKGTVSFHGLYAVQFNGLAAKMVPISPGIKGSLLLMHGYEDPLNSPEDIKAIQEEMTKNNVDWQMHIFGQTMHSFTDPDAHKPEQGMNYNQKSESRAMLLAHNFYQEVFR